jgi:signal transduction histidine kinase/CBS domain-containing protein
MTFYQPQIYSSPLEQAIDRHPLTAMPETPVAAVLKLMNQVQSSCNLPAIDSATAGEGKSEIPLWEQTRGSCVLVLESPKAKEQSPKSRLAGIFTDRDIVEILVNGKIDSQKNSVPNQLVMAQVMSKEPIALTESEDKDLFAVLSIFRQHNISHLPILNETGEVVGVLTPERIRPVLLPSNILKLRRVTEVMTPPITAPRTTSLLEIAQILSKHEVNCAVITDVKKVKEKKRKSEGVSIVHRSFQEPVGILTARDLVQALFLEIDLAATPVDKVMKTSLNCLKPTDSLWVAHKQMQQQQEQRLVIRGQEGELQGIVTQASLLQVLDPTEMHKVVKKLQQSVYQLQAEKLELLRTRNEELEKEVRERTAKLQEQLERDRLLAQIAMRIHQSLDLEKILNAAVAEVQQFLKADRVVVYRIEPADVATVVAESVGEGWRSWLGNMLPSLYVLENNEPSDRHFKIQAVGEVPLADLSAEKIDWLTERQIQAYLVVPIVQDGQLWGIMSTHQCSASRQWQPSEIDLLEKLATQLAIAIQQAQLYQQVQTLNADLEMQVKERTVQLEQKIQELQTLHVLKDEFLSTVSHELRTPLANMKMAIHMLKIVPTSEKCQRYLQILESECVRESELINDLLDLQRLEAATQPISKEEVNLSTWLPTIIESFRDRTKSRQQTITVQLPEKLPIINSNRASLGRVLAELLNNGCKYTPNQGEIVFQVEINGGKSQDKIQFMVSNQAEIPASELPKIFDKFYRVPNADPWKQGGTGLGLALVKKLVEQLGGNLAVTSGDGWTTFTMELGI